MTNAMITALIFHQFQKRLFLHVAIALMVSLLPWQKAMATTGFARQTGEPCSSCHMQAYGPWLTQYGQKFKLDGYVAGNANALPNALNPFSLETVASYTNTAKNVPTGQYYSNKQSGSSNMNNNLVNDWDALYYTGRVADHVGAYLQLNLNPQVGHSVNLAMADIRIANHAKVLGNNLTYGLTFNNSPTMSDTWMSSYAWMYPYTQSSVALKPTAQPFLQLLMANATTAGSTAYLMINNHLYLEGGAYTSQAANMAGGLGGYNNSQGQGPFNGQIVGAAPYWRAYLQHTTGPHTMMVGGYGLNANVVPYYSQGFNTDNYTETNVDSNYSYMMDNDNMFMAMFRYSHDTMKMGASSALGASTNANNNLDAVMLMGMWTYKQTYNLTAGWNRVTGSGDTLLYNGAGANIANGGAANFGGPAALTGSANSSPNSNWFLFQADYVPFGKGTFKFDPYLNMRFSMQYLLYTQFNGASSNYDGAGRNASDNNTLYFSTNVMF
jgi:hypothetical protein